MRLFIGALIGKNPHKIQESDEITFFFDTHACIFRPTGLTGYPLPVCGNGEWENQNYSNAKKEKNKKTIKVLFEEN